MSESESEARPVDQDVASGAAAGAAARVEFWPREISWRAYVERARAGDQESLARLYDESSHLVYTVAYRILGHAADAEEVTLDVYTQVWRDAVKFSPERGTVSAWLVLLARSRAIDRLRSSSARRSAELPLPASHDLPDPALRPDELGAASQQRRIILRALALLSAEQREAIELAFFAGLTHAELAARLGEPLGTVKTRIRLGMMKLRELLNPSAHGFGKGQGCDTTG